MSYSTAPTSVLPVRNHQRCFDIEIARMPPVAMNGRVIPSTFQVATGNARNSTATRINDVTTDTRADRPNGSHKAKPYMPVTRCRAIRPIHAKSSETMAILNSGIMPRPVGVRIPPRASVSTSWIVK